MDRLAAKSHRANDRYMRQFDGPPGSAPVARAGDLGSVGASIERAAPISSFPGAFSPRVTRGWRAGPADPRGGLVDLSDRPILCGAVDCDRGVAYLGCSDHAAYAVSTEYGKKAATLYGKKSGHSEWVTGVAVLGDGSGRVVTCGMDGKLIVWAPPGGAARPGPSAASQQCAELAGHFGSVSAVACAPPGTGWGHVVVSAGYDKTVRVWVPDADAAPRHKLVGHDAPVLVLGVTAGGATLLAASGDREGVARTWDCAAGRPLAELRGHKGHLTALEWLCERDDASKASAAAVAAPALLCTGAQDGHVKVRTRRGDLWSNSTSSLGRPPPFLPLRCWCRCGTPALLRPPRRCLCTSQGVGAAL